MAVWQALQVQSALTRLNIRSGLVMINSSADSDLETPLYAFGITGIFTKNLDLALIQNRIDIAVHSLKDVPTLLPEGLQQFAVLERGQREDVLVKGPGYNESQTGRMVATGSLRRGAFWLNRYPQDEICSLRGNLNTRLQKVKESTWHGAVFAAAGLSRLGLLGDDSVKLNWMISAPAQGVVAVLGRIKDTELFEQCSRFNHVPTAIEAKIERDFLRKMEGGCTAPIGASATVHGDTFDFDGVVLSVNGREMKEIHKRNLPIAAAGDAGERFAGELLAIGGKAIMDVIRSNQAGPEKGFEQ